MSKKNIVLIGMPGAGKSTIGVLLAKALGLDFTDTDVAIQVQEGQTLQSILDQHGYLRLREIEEQVILAHSFHREVVATGGSAVYSEAAMGHLAAEGVIVFLDLPLDQLRKRIKNFSTRGIARLPGQDFESLYCERRVLYERFMDLHVSVGKHSAEQVIETVLAGLASLPEATELLGATVR
jgi:shikimate kinase